VVIYIPTEIAQVHGYHKEWYNITWILHYQKIQKYIIHEEIYKNWEVLTSSKRTSGAKQEKSWEEELHRCPSFCCTPITMRGSAAHSDQLQKDHHGPDSRIWTWESRVIRCNPRVHITKPSGVHIRYMCTRKVYREYKHIRTWSKTVSKVTTGNQLYKLTLPISGLVRRRNNPNKETLIYIPYTSRHCNLSLYNLTLPSQYNNETVWKQLSNPTR